MDNSLGKFQDLLRRLFQFDCADLDFGIYRILNLKRQQVGEFITERLPKMIDEAFSTYAAEDTEAAEQALKEKRQEIKSTLGNDAIDDNEQLNSVYHKTPLGKQYLELQAKAKEIQISEDTKIRVYNDLYTFFSRYYEDGDFISKRRRAKNETYAIPYNGQEVMLHWANRDQYYIKTSEQFKFFRFITRGFIVVFELRNASTEMNNNQGVKRYFVVSKEDPVSWDAKAKKLTVFLEYRPLTDSEKITYGKTENQKTQEKLNAATVQTVLSGLNNAELKKIMSDTNGNDTSILHKKLTEYTRRNTSDFFIHKNLGEFLRRELEFYMKNEVLLIDELINGSEADLQKHIQRARVLRNIAEKIIDFLAQVEDFQRRLFEKRKFVIRTEYCITIDRVPKELWDEILKNKKQIDEWKKLLALDTLVNQDKKSQPLMHNGLDKEFLKRHPSMVVDTKHFTEDFKWRLLASFDDLDEAIDGVLMKSENFQALNLLREKYGKTVQCVYIDPPYNTGSDDFIYKDNYQHSSWLSMIEDRLNLSSSLMSEDGVVFISIDEKEMPRLKELMSQVFSSYVGELVWKNATDNNPTQIAQEHEYVLCYAKDGQKLSSEWKSTYSESKETLLNYYEELKRSNQTIPEMTKEFQAFIKHNKITIGQLVRYKHIDEEGPYTGSESVHNPHPGGYDYEIKHPGTGKPMRKPANGYRFPWETMKKDYIDKDRLLYGVDEDRIVKIKLYLRDYVDALRSVYPLDGRLGAYTLKALFGDFSIYNNPKPVQLIERLVSFATDDHALVLDFFAGSGTTAQAIIDFRRKYNRTLRYVLVEMGDWFDKVILSRIKKSVFCENWKAGKPLGGEGISHIFKYQILEQYEDTLNNLELPRGEEGQMSLELFGDEYLLRYMLDFETQGSQSLLNLDNLKTPFSYKMKIQDGDEAPEQTVDLIETFNYLLGLQVRKLRTFENKGLHYRTVLGEKDNKSIVVIWRQSKELEEHKDKLQEDKQFIESKIFHQLLGGKSKPDRLLINGSCYVAEAEAIEPEFARLMFMGVQ